MAMEKAIQQLILTVAVAIAAIVAIAAESQLETSAAATRAIANATGAALQGDASRAVETLRSLSENDLNDRDATFRRCMLERFDTGRGPARVDQIDDAVRGALESYRRYWHASLLSPDKRPELETVLLRELRHLLELDDDVEVDTIEKALNERMRRAGFQSLQGQTGVMRELMMWRRHERRMYHVALPEGAYDTTAILLDDFASLGWGDYATCGRRGTGGWAKIGRALRGRASLSQPRQ